ncbi:MAG: hypothetical protein Q8942_10300 [Bacillota bacterium]|nr:hypothetical protein [Bacillota bacterium]
MNLYYVNDGVAGYKALKIRGFKKECFFGHIEVVEFLDVNNVEMNLKHGRM